MVALEVRSAKRSSWHSLMRFSISPRALFAGEAGIGAQEDAHLGPAAANLGNDARHRLRRAVRRITARPPQLGIQQMASAEHVKRQITIAVVIAVEGPALLLPMHRVISGIKIDDDLARRSYAPPGTDRPSAA